MAQRLDAFPDDAPNGRRRYPWHQWTDGAAWEIRRGEDYDVATENMRVNLHMKADSLGRKVRTRKVRGDQHEGLIFQFIGSEDEQMTTMTGDPAIDALYDDALELYELARQHVTITKADGTTQRYAPVRYKQRIDEAYAAGELLIAIARMVSRTTQGFGHLERARRPDLMLEALVLDPSKPYHHLFSPATLRAARQRMDECLARNGR